MFRWLRKIEDKARGGVCFVEFGDEHATEAAAVLQLRGAEIQAGDAFALVCRNVTAQVTVTLDGLDDVPAAPAEPGVHDLVMRRRRKALETVASAAAVVGEAAAVALTGSDADVLAASGTNSTVEAPAVIVGERPQIEPIAGMVASGPDSDVELDGANDPDLDRIPLPAAIPDAAADLAARVGSVGEARRREARTVRRCAAVVAEVRRRDCGGKLRAQGGATDRGRRGSGPVLADHDRYAQGRVPGGLAVLRTFAAGGSRWCDPGVRSGSGRFKSGRALHL